MTSFHSSFSENRIPGHTEIEDLPLKFARCEKQRSKLTQQTAVSRAQQVNGAVVTRSRWGFGTSKREAPSSALQTRETSQLYK